MSSPARYRLVCFPQTFVLHSPATVARNPKHTIGLGAVRTVQLYSARKHEANWAAELLLKSSAVPAIKPEPKPELCVVGIVHIALLETSKQTKQYVISTVQQALSGTSAPGKLGRVSVAWNSETQFSKHCLGKLGRVSVAWNSETTHAVCCSHG